MPKPKKRLSKNAKAALKAVTESKALNAAKTEAAGSSGGRERAEQVTPRTASANKLRPEKKRG
jgi:hypothetical protein